jgi:hypothetical protein
MPSPFRNPEHNRRPITHHRSDVSLEGHRGDDPHRVTGEALPEPDSFKDIIKEESAILGRRLQSGFMGTNPMTKAATIATAAAGVVGAATGHLPPDTAVMVTAAAPVLPLAREASEMLGSHMEDRRANPDPNRLTPREAANPARWFRGLLEPPGDPNKGRRPSK